MNRKLIYALLALALIPAAFAHNASDFTAAQQLLAEHPACDNLTQAQFALIGDYAMQQALGDAHEAMDQMMGGDGSPRLEAMHVAWGERYLGCGYTGNGTDADGSYAGMGPGMMGYYGANTTTGYPAYGVMGGQNGYSGYGMMGGYPAAQSPYARRFVWYGLSGVVLWVLAVVFLVSGSWYFITTMRRKRK